jgi:hypothetical protein
VGCGCSGNNSGNRSAVREKYVVRGPDGKEHGPYLTAVEAEAARVATGGVVITKPA